jgi:phosphoserine phosphatase
MYTQVIYCLEQVHVLAEKKPELKNIEPFKAVLSGDREAMAKFTMKDLEKILAATLTGMTVEEFNAGVKGWLATAKDRRFKHLYTELTYQPMLEVMKLLRDHGYKTYFVTGGGQDFVRVYSEQVYGVPREQVVGTVGATQFGYDKAGKPEGIHMMIGRRPVAAFGNSIGDKQMLEYTGAGDGARLMLLVHHDDAEREYAYGPKSKVGTFPDALMAEAKSKGWTVISMKNDWKKIFAFEK